MDCSYEGSEIEKEPKRLELEESSFKLMELSRLEELKDLFLKK
jgi:hypothetical protein